MKSSPFAKNIYADIVAWEDFLLTSNSILDVWKKAQ